MSDAPRYPTPEEVAAERRAMAIEVAIHAHQGSKGQARMWGAYVDATWPAEALLGVIEQLGKQIDAHNAFRRPL